MQTLTCYLGAVYKGRPQSGGAVQCGKGYSSDADVRTIWCKNFGIFEIYGVSTRTRGEGVNFSRFCADVFYGRPI